MLKLNQSIGRSLRTTVVPKKAWDIRYERMTVYWIYNVHNKERGQPIAAGMAWLYTKLCTTWRVNL